MNDPANPSAQTLASRARFHKMAWAYLVYLLFVILFGAVVRISGSGAGCGQNWPSCHGEMLMIPDNIHTAIEYAHRQTSGLALPFSLVLAFFAFKRFDKGHLVRRGMVFSILFLLVEAGIGARLVLLNLVGLNDSWPRAYWMTAHLSSTYVLTAVTGLIVWASGRSEASETPTRQRKVGLQLLAGLGALYLVGATGAITALGDTLYPVEQLNELGATLRETLEADQASSAHFLRRMRMVHPAVAIFGGVFVAWLGLSLPGRAGAGPEDTNSVAGRRLAILVFVQLCAGVTNIWLGAPGWMQVVHLGMACIVWLALVWLAFGLWLKRRA